MFEKVHKLSFKILYLFHRDFFYLNYRKLCETFPFSFTKVTYFYFILSHY